MVARLLQLEGNLGLGTNSVVNRQKVATKTEDQLQDLGLLISIQGKKC